MPNTSLLLQPLVAALDVDVVKAEPLQGGCVAQVLKVWLSDGRVVVAKIGPEKQDASVSLDTEGWMLAYLAEYSDLPVPPVFYSSPNLLVMEALPGESRFDAASQTHAAELLAGLHGIRGLQFGLERDTLIGGLPQPNPSTDSWLDFYAEHRVLAMARLAYGEGVLSAALLNRLERFCDRLSTWLEEPEHPSLLHGDVWTTNLLTAQGRITGVLDPAIYYGHPEVELAFTTLFGTFGEPFFRRYNEIRPIADGFFEVRRDIYYLYPLLVHVRLFGGSYARDVARILHKLGG